MSIQEKYPNQWDFNRLYIESKRSALPLYEVVTNSPDMIDINELDEQLKARGWSDRAEQVEQALKQLKAKDRPVKAIFNDDNKLLLVGADGEAVNIMTGKESGKTIVMDLPKEDGMPYYLFRVLGKLSQEMAKNDPEEVARREQAAARAQEINRRQQRIQSIPEMPEDFWDAMKALADWSQCREEFIEALSPSMFDLSDRNLTRLSRAMMSMDCFQDDGTFERVGDEGESITVYRLQPMGCEIEAGDWVTTDPAYAQMHESNVKGRFYVQELEVDGGEVWWDQTDVHEAVYIPEGLWGAYYDIEQVWESLTEGLKPDTYDELTQLTSRKSRHREHGSGAEVTI